MSQRLTQLSVAVGSVVVGVLPGAYTAAQSSIPLGVAIVVAGVGAATALGAMLLSARSDTDLDPSIGFVVGPALAIGASLLQWSGAPRDPLARGLAGAAIVIGPALALGLVIRWRLDPGAAATLATPDLVRRAVGSARVLDLAMRELPGRPDALESIVLAFPATSGLARARAVRLAAEVNDQDRPATLQLVREALATPRGPIGDQVVGAAVDAAVRLRHPDLIAPLRALAGPGGAPAFLKARAACGDLDVVTELFDARVPDAVAQESVRLLGEAAVPALAAALGTSAPEATIVRLLELSRALGQRGLSAPVAAAAADGRPAVRAAAFRALAEIDAAGARALAEGALADADEAVGFWARELVARARQG